MNYPKKNCELKNRKKERKKKLEKFNLVEKKREGGKKKRISMKIN